MLHHKNMSQKIHIINKICSMFSLFCNVLVDIFTARKGSCGKVMFSYVSVTGASGFPQSHVPGTLPLRRHPLQKAAPPPSSKKADRPQTADLP